MNVAPALKELCDIAPYYWQRKLYIGTMQFILQFLIQNYPKNA